MINHAEIKDVPLAGLLDDLASFQRVLSTNHRVRALSDAIRAGTAPLPDPDPALNALEQQGKTVFVRACTQCHGGPAPSNASIARFHDIASQCPRPVDTVTPARFAFAPCPDRLARSVRTYEFTQRALLTGFVGGVPPTDDWNKFVMPGLRGIRNTPPYFHNNSAATLEEVVDHYAEPLLAYLRKL